VKGRAGKCSMDLKGVRKGLEYCLKMAREGGLIQDIREDDVSIEKRGISR